MQIWGEKLEEKNFLKEVIYRDLHKKIIENELMPGDRLVESRIGQDYKASRTPVRDALQQLGDEKLAKYLPRKGYIVSKISMKEILDLYEVRRVLEPAAMEHLARTIDEADKIALKEIVIKIEKCLNIHDYDAAKEEIIHWNQKAIQAVKNPYIKKYLLSNNEKLYRLSNYLFKFEENMTAMLPYIKQMMEYIESGERVRIFEASKLYIENIISLIENYNDPSVFSLR